MKLGKKELIGTGAIAGFFIGKAISGMFFGELFFNDLTARHLVVIVFCIVAGGFIGHVMRHAPEHDKDQESEKDN